MTLILPEGFTPGPWWYDEDENCWRLHGGGEWQGMAVHGRQILKAPKRDTPYAEYWPNEADTRLIVMAPDLVAEVVRLREELAREHSRAERYKFRLEIETRIRRVDQGTAEKLARVLEQGRQHARTYHQCDFLDETLPIPEDMWDAKEEEGE